MTAFLIRKKYLVSHNKNKTISLALVRSRGRRKGRKTRAVCSQSQRNVVMQWHAVWIYQMLGQDVCQNKGLQGLNTTELSFDSMSRLECSGFKGNK